MKYFILTPDKPTMWSYTNRDIRINAKNLLGYLENGNTLFDKIDKSTLVKELDRVPKDLIVINLQQSDGDITSNTIPIVETNT